MVIYYISDMRGEIKMYNLQYELDNLDEIIKNNNKMSVQRRDQLLDSFRVMVVANMNELFSPYDIAIEKTKGDDAEVDKTVRSLINSMKEFRSSLVNLTMKTDDSKVIIGEYRDKLVNEMNGNSLLA